METLEEKIEGPPKSPREKDSSKAMEAEAQEIQDTKEKLKLVGNERGKMPESVFKGKFPVWVLRLGTVSGS